MAENLNEEHDQRNEMSQCVTQQLSRLGQKTMSHLMKEWKELIC